MPSVHSIALGWKAGAALKWYWACFCAWSHAGARKSEDVAAFLLEKSVPGRLEHRDDIRTLMILMTKKLGRIAKRGVEFL